MKANVFVTDTGAYIHDSMTLLQDKLQIQAITATLSDTIYGLQQEHHCFNV
jgi:hypothetical protein